MDDSHPTVVAPIQHKGRKGFLPFTTNTFDRVFVSIYIFVAVCLLWMRFIEPINPTLLPVGVAAILCVALGVWIVWKG